MNGPNTSLKTEKTTKELQNVFIFWLGKTNIIDNLVADLTSKGFNVIVGPTSDEHNYLMTIEYYKNSYNQKIFAFCSDVWRVWKLSRSSGMYIDVSVSIGENFHEFYNDVTKFDAWLFKESRYLVGSAIMYSRYNQNDIFDNVFETYKKINNPFVRILPIGPVFITAEVQKMLNFENWETNISNNIFVATLPTVRNPLKIIKHGANSWSSVSSKGYLENYKEVDPWKTIEDRWHSKNDKWYSKEFTWQVKLINSGIPVDDIVDIKKLRNLFDNSKDTNERIELKEIYKKAKKWQKIKITERLIWSQIYVFFKG